MSYPSRAGGVVNNNNNNNNDQSEWLLTKYENLLNSGLRRSDWPQGKTEGRRKQGQIPRPCQRIEYTMAHEIDDNTIVIVKLGAVTKGLEQGLEVLESSGRVETI